MEKLCDTCGHIGFCEALITCCQCKEISRHMYCMKIYLEKPINDWLCEECSLSKPSSPCVLEESADWPKITSSESEVCKGVELRSEGRRNWEKIVATGKTQYISVKEAIKLSSGENRYPPSSSNAFHPKSPQRKTGTSRFDAANRRRPELLNFSSLQNLPSGPYQPSKPRGPGNTEIRRKQLQQSTKPSELQSQSSLRPSEALKDTHCVKEQPREVQLPATRKTVKQTSSPLGNASPVTVSGGGVLNNAINLRTSGAENMRKTHLLDSEKYMVPALDTLWKGSFKIQDDHARKEMNHLVQAHPPSRVLRKVFEFSKQMPDVLQFKVVPSRPLLNNLFDYSPDKRDIALYFFPGDGDRSEEDYSFLVDHMISTNYALREQIADVELLIFTSKLLPGDCQCWEGKYFLWGVFHRVKHATQSTTMVQPSGNLKRDQNQIREGEEVDMEVDMIGGRKVGRIDVPVPKKPLSVKFKEDEPRAALASPESAPKTAFGQTPATKISPVNVKVEPPDLIPPGFEEVYSLRIQRSLSSTNKSGDQHTNKGQNGQ